MSKNLVVGLSGALLFSIITGKSNAQALSLKDAVQTALTNYGTTRAKANYAKASQANVTETKREYLPALNISAQQSYGTVNSQYGPLAAYKVPGVSSAGPI